MIILDIPVKDWLKKHQALEVIEDNCNSCGAAMVADIPFIEKDWAGLRSNNCACGESPAFSITTPISEFSKNLIISTIF